MRTRLLSTFLAATGILLAAGASATTQTVNVGQGGNFFSPTNFTITLGDTVKFVWVSGFHNVTGTTIPGGANAINSSNQSTPFTYTYVPNVTGTYNYTCTLHSGMNGAFTVNPNTNPPTTPSISPAGPLTACAGQVPQLTATSTGATSYQWKLNTNNISGATSATYTPTQSGSYTVTATNANGTSAASAAVQVTVNPVPVVSATHSSASVCPGKCDTITLSSSVAGTSYSYTIQGGTGGGPVTGNKLVFCINPPGVPGPVVLVVTGTASGCAGTSNQTVTVLPAPTASFSHTHTGLTYNFTNTSTGGTTYLWTVTPGSQSSTLQNPSFTFPSPGTYQVTLAVTNGSNCTTTTTQSLTALSLTNIPGAEHFLFGPNPASQTLTIKTGGLQAELNLYDYTGKFIRNLSAGSKAAEYQVNIADIPAGMYLLQVKANGATAMEKLLIQR